WMLHNPSHYAMVCADGPAIDFEYRGSEHVAEGIETTDQVRPATSWFYFTAGPRLGERVEKWADEVVDVLREHGGGNRRLAVDKLQPPRGGAARRARNTPGQGAG